MKRYLVIELEGEPGDITFGDEVQIHRWLEPNTEAREAVADGKIAAVIVSETDGPFRHLFNKS